MKDSGGPFVFCTELRLVVLTGRKARNLEELLNHLTEVSGASIFFHTHDLYLTHHFETPRFYNEFAKWAAQALQDEELAERLADIDLLTFTTIRDIREATIDVVRKHVEANKRVAGQCLAGEEFYFCEAKSFSMSTGLVAGSLKEFFEKLAQVTNSSMHYHFFEARLRLGRATNDFSQWLTSLGEITLAKRIDRLNPYAMTLDELKLEIVKLGKD